MQLYENMLIEWQDLSEAQTDNVSSIGPRVERVLNYDLKTKEVMVINLFNVSSPNLTLDPKAWPILRSLDQIEDAHKHGILIIRENDPFDHLIRPEDKIKLSHRGSVDAMLKIY